MVRLFLTVFVCLLAPFRGFAISADSLPAMEQRLILMGNDTVKVSLLLELGRHYCSTENEKALIYLQQALTLSGRLGYDRGIGRSYLWQGRVYYYKDDYVLAGSYLEKARQVLEKNGDKGDLAFCHFAAGALNNLNGNFIYAIREYQESARLAGMAGDESLRSTSIVSIGAINNDLNEPLNALVYFREGLHIEQRINDQSGIASTYTNMGASFEKLGRSDSALYYYRKGYLIRLSLKESRSIASSELSLGMIYRSLKRYDEAITLFEKATGRYLRLQEKAGLSMATVQLALALDKAGRPVDAKEKALEALHLARNLKNLVLVSDCYAALTTITAASRQFHEAYQYTVLKRSIDDTLVRQQKARVIKETEARFRLQQISSKMDQLVIKTMAQRRNILFLSISFVTILVILVLIILLYRSKLIAKSRQMKVMEQAVIIREQQEKLAEKEQQILRDQVESQSRELAAKALEMLRVNETLGRIINRLQNMDRMTSDRPDQAGEISHIVREIELHTQTNTWQEFDIIFRNIHSGFYDRLLERCPDLTSAEIKIAALLKLNLTTKEIAAITMKSEEGIKSTRYRLRKKLDLASDDHLIPFLMQM